MKVSIPGYYELSSDSTDNLKVFSATEGKDGAFLDLLYLNMYNDGGEMASVMSQNADKIKANQSVFDDIVDRNLDSALRDGLSNIGAYNVQYVREWQMDGIPAKEYTFNAKINGYDLNGRLVGSLNIMNGDVYAVMIAESDNSSTDFVSSMNSIISSADIAD